jgi:hypothetical protein
MFIPDCEHEVKGNRESHRAEDVDGSLAQREKGKRGREEEYPILLRRTSIGHGITNVQGKKDGAKHPSGAEVASREESAPFRAHAWIIG